jgi:hypothetical protein
VRLEPRLGGARVGDRIVIEVEADERARIVLEHQQRLAARHGVFASEAPGHARVAHEPPHVLPARQPIELGEGALQVVQPLSGHPVRI